MAKRSRTETIRVTNCSKQMIPIQAKPPGGDFYRNEQQVRIRPGASIELPKSYLMEEQIVNLQKRGMIRVLSEDKS